jgi:chromosome segregation ATPase
MSQGEQTMLRYKYLMQATSDAQGDFSRTSDGYANSMRKLQTNVDKLKTSLGKGLIDAVTEATGWLNSMLESLEPDESKRTVLDDIADIDLKTEAKITDIQKTADEARLLIEELEKIGGANTAGAADVEGKTGGLEAAVEALGSKTNRTAEEQALWLETCKRLVKTIPGLSSIINTETGEIKGGTDAVKDYVKAWEEGQTKLALLGALTKKESAVSERFADLPGLQLDAALAERRVREQRKKIDELREKYFPDRSNEYGAGNMIVHSGLFAQYTDAEKEWNAANREYEALVKSSNEANEAYDRQTEALKEAETALEEYRATIDEMPGSVEQAASASEQFWIDNADNIKLVVNAADEALKALEDYAKGVHDAARQAVDSVANSLNRVDYQAYSNQIEKISELTQKQAQYKVGSDEWKKLQAEIDKANESLIDTNNIYKNLETQSQFLGDYLDNIRKAREMGVDNNLLAELSDGSVESAEYLDALVNDKTGKSVEEINAKYQEIQEKKAALSTELANQQLTVDQTYQSLAEKAKEAVAALDLQGEAAANSGATVSGIAQGISDHVSEVSGAVDSIIAELERLNGYGIDIDFGGFGNITFTTSTGKTEGSGRMGIPLVPHDDYIARLHEGERVLTAQENQIWNALRNGGIAGFDLEALGGVMRDNVKTGGNVYLDGRTVGQVISDQQGKSYRQLQRSGWQG